MSKNLIGIEIGNGSVAMYQGGANPKVLLERMPENLVANGNIVSPELLAEMIKGMKKEGGFQGKDCTVIMPEMNTFFRSLQMPPITEKQLKLNLPYEFRDFVGTDSFKYNYDYALDGYVKDEEGKVTALNLLAAACSKEKIDEYEAVLKRAGLRMACALPREMAVINLVRSAIARGASADKTYCMVDIGFAHTRVYIFQGGDLTAAKVIDVGLREIDVAIGNYFGIDAYLAASYRETNHEGILDTSLCEEVYDRIALEIMKAVNFYKYENQSSEIEECYFCGSGSQTGEFTEEILEYIQLQRGNMDELLPTNLAGNRLAYEVAASVGAVEM